MKYCKTDFFWETPKTWKLTVWFLSFQISGCQDVEYTAAEMKFVDCNVHSLSASAIFTEDGTDIAETASGHMSINRKAVTFKTLYADAYMKPNLPYTLKVNACLTLVNS